MEPGCRRIVFQGTRKCICQMAGRIHISCQNIRCRKAAFHAALVCKQGTADLLIIPDPARLHNAADIQHNNHFRKVLSNRLHQPALRIGKAEVSIFKKLLRELQHLLFAESQLVRIRPDRLAVPALP